MLIGLGHKKRTGKDMAAEYLVREYGFKRIAFADALRNAVEAIFGLSQEQMLSGALKEVPDAFWGFSPRDATIGVGELIKKIHPEVWVLRTMQKVDEWLANGESVVIPDVRFKVETKAVKQRKGYVVRVYRPSVYPRKLWGLWYLQKQSHTETQLDRYNFDATIRNDENKEEFFSRLDSLVRSCR